MVCNERVDHTWVALAYGKHPPLTHMRGVRASRDSFDLDSEIREIPISMK